MHSTAPQRYFLPICATLRKVFYLSKKEILTKVELRPAQFVGLEFDDVNGRRMVFLTVCEAFTLGDRDSVCRIGSYMSVAI